MLTLMPWKKERKDPASLATRTENPLSSFRDEIDTLFDRFFDRWSPWFGDLGGAGWGLEMEEKDNETICRADAAGFEPKDFDIQVRGGMLRIHAEHRETKNGDTVAERRFERQFTLPTDVDADKVQASYRNGVLEVHLPRSKQAQPKKIEVKA